MGKALKWFVVLAIGAGIAAVVMITILQVAVGNSSRWPMATSATIAAITLSVTIGGTTWVNRPIRPAGPGGGSAVPVSRQVVRNSKINGSGGPTAAIMNDVTVTYGSPDGGSPR
jgi:hypothetical protein